MEILKYFPSIIKNNIIDNLNEEEKDKLEEIRIRNNLPIILKLGQVQKVLNYKITNEDIEYIFQKICDNSIYAYQKEISNGFITLKGGNRVGICGTCVINNHNEVINLNHISSLNFRISRQVLGCGNEIMNEIYDTEVSIYNTLIVSKPGMGKTTLLRDIIRNISNGINNNKAMNVSVIDERGEIAAMYKGKNENDLGIRTDIINNVSKDIGIRMAIRTMSPEVVCADEIGKKEDVEAIKYAILSGVKGIFTAHGKSIDDIRKNKELRELLEDKIIEKVIIINERKNGQYKFSIIKL